MARSRNLQNPRVRSELLPTALALRAARERRGMLQSQLADALGVSIAAVSHYELATRPIPPERLVMCARVLGDASLALMPQPESRRALRRAGRPEEVAATLASSLLVTAWWQKEQSKLTKLYDATNKDLADAHAVLGRYVADALEISQEMPGQLTEARLLELAKLFLPAITSLFERRHAGRGAAA